MTEGAHELEPTDQEQSTRQPRTEQDSSPLRGRSTAERVRTAALELFAQHGFEATGIRELSRAAGVSVATLYYHMGTKESYLSELMTDALQKLLAPAVAISEEGMPADQRLSLLVKNHVESHIERRVQSLISDTEIKSLGPNDRASIISLRDRYQHIWERSLAQGMDEHIFAIPDVKLATFALLEMNTGVVFWYHKDGRLSIEEVVKTFTCLSLNLVGYKKTETTQH